MAGEVVNGEEGEGKGLVIDAFLLSFLLRS